jgi:eukaryotic-like serine/threonine-protein kinase
MRGANDRMLDFGESLPLTTGTRLGPYEVVAPLGAGGMGEVYRARDVRLDRTVAIKVLSTQLVASPELRARFEREAKIISQLQHPHICVLHDVGREADTEFLVMEFLEGESLADRLKRGPLAAPELLKVAIQVADALEKAHRAGVVHRDLKPGNVMLTKSGAKLLDFGLAKPVGATMSSGVGSTASVSVFAAAMTQTSPAPSPSAALSVAGSVIGTVQYMSPEQIQGIEADARSDVFAFGLLLFEMATGKRAFEGKTQASVVGQILAVDPPPVSALRADSPAGLDRVIRLCMEKDPDERIQTAHDLKLQLQGISEAPTASLTSEPPAVTPTRGSWLPWAAVALLGLVAAGLGVIAYTRGAEAPTSSLHAYILPPEKATFVLAGNVSGQPVISPDGKRLAFVAKAADGNQQLWIRPLSSAVAQAMSGTQNATYPFWSPDSRYVGFFANGKLNKVDASGGPPQVLCDATGRGGTWSSTGTIIFAKDTLTGLMRTDAAGGTPVDVTTLGTEETSHRWPDFLPDGKHFLYFAHNTTPGHSGVFLASLDSKQSKLIFHNDSNAIYAAPGYLLFVRDNTLMAQPFDASKLALTGEARPLADHVAVNTDIWRSIITASDNGMLLYQGGTTGGTSQLVWYDRAGKAGQLVLPASGDYHTPLLSPDDSKLVVDIDDNGIGDLWVIDLARATKTRITFGPNPSTNPVWWPDGKSVVYASGATGSQTTLYRKNADGTGSPNKLLEIPGSVLFPFSVTRDGQYLVFMKLDQRNTNNWDIWALPMFGDRKPFPVVSTPFMDVTGVVSPDGKWLAYANNESGRMEVYLQPFPSGSGRWQVSTAGGVRPEWRKDGKELYFFSGDQQIMAVDVAESGTGLQLGAPHELMKVPTVSGPSGPYTGTADGNKFILNVLMNQSNAEPLSLVTNWTADLK